ncbi:MAG: hypothetical protein CMG75_02005 [Candidatus Marinimicrobia bacterium]|nr:hypothetical protein [Candidatus Neomarinimicrobiota bacterium]|tara:strand:+ start:57 stop:236 length:180 start_codon:yes stop_codon:yes gene_type:complete
MFKIISLFLVGYLVYKLINLKKFLFNSYRSVYKKESSILGIRDEDIREAEFKDIEREDI